jgi:hypothetical protein
MAAINTGDPNQVKPDCSFDRASLFLGDPMELVDEAIWVHSRAESISRKHGSER